MPPVLEQEKDPFVDDVPVEEDELQHKAVNGKQEHQMAGL